MISGRTRHGRFRPGAHLRSVISAKSCTQLKKFLYRTFNILLFFASKSIDIASSYVIVGLFKVHYYKFLNIEGIFWKKWKFQILGEKNMNKSPICKSGAVTPGVWHQKVSMLYSMGGGVILRLKKNFIMCDSKTRGCDSKSMGLWNTMKNLYISHQNTIKTN